MSGDICEPQTQAPGDGEPLLPPVSKVRPQTPSLLKHICRFLSVGALAVASYFIISHFLLQTVEVVGVSMMPTLHDSDHYFLNRWIYHLRSPKRSDVVVIRDPVDNGCSVKRIVGLQGDIVYLRDGNVYLNGAVLKEPYLLQGTPTYPYGLLKQQVLICGKDQFLVLGDNRKNSADSRTYGVIGRERILGQLIY